MYVILYVISCLSFLYYYFGRGVNWDFVVIFMVFCLGFRLGFGAF